MRIVVLGAGAMGSWFGGQLARQGCFVQLLTTNRAHRQAVQKNGLTLRSAAGEERIEIPIDAPENLSGRADLILLMTKSFQSDQALSGISHVLDEGTAILSLQNGLGNAEIIARYVKPENIWLGVSMMPVDMIEPGTVAAKGAGISYFGNPLAHADPMTEQILEAFAQTGIDIRADSDIYRRIWEKVAFNSGMNALCALAHTTPGPIGRLPEALALVKSVAREVAEVANAQNIKIDLQGVFDTIEFACARHGEHKASMLQDLLAGKRTEVAALSGAVAELAGKAGITAPKNKMLTTLIRLAEVGQQAHT